MRPILLGLAVLLASAATQEAGAQSRSGVVTSGEAWNRGQDFDTFRATTRQQQRDAIQRRAAQRRRTAARSR